jgi:hypothetical protein
MSSLILLRPPKAPNLLNAPKGYDSLYIDQLNNALRLYFKQVDNFCQTVLTGTGGGSLAFPFGGCVYQGTQTAAAATITTIAWDAANFGVGIIINTPTTKINFLTPGVYNLEFSIQFVNNSAQTDNVTIWIRKNGVDVVESAGVSGIPPKHGVVNGALIVGWSELFSINAGDYIEMCWITDTGTSSIVTYPAGTSPVHPVSPGAALNATFVSSQVL